MLWSKVGLYLDDELEDSELSRLQAGEVFLQKKCHGPVCQQKIRTLNIFNHELFFSNMDFYMGYSPISGSKSTLGERVSYPAV